MNDVMVTSKIVARARSEGFEISEYMLRRWIKAGVIPVRLAGRKQLIYYPLVIRHLKCEDGGDIQPTQPAPVMRVGGWR